MINFSKKNVKTITIIVSIIIFILIQITFTFLNSKEDSIVYSMTQETQNNNIINDENMLQMQEKIAFVNTNLKGQAINKIEDPSWMLEIPKINLKAPIVEGITEGALEKGIGHFDETSVLNGNICLASHNRASKGDFFKDLKKIELGDVIIYRKDNEEKKYIVQLVKEINETNWTYLENTQDNRITLITCIENAPEIRLCVQGVEI